MKRFALCVLLACSAACGGSGKVKPPSATPVFADDKPVLTRMQLEQTIDRGLGELLSHVTLADLPVSRGGIVVGYQVVAHDDALGWRMFDVRPGDVVISVNDGSLATPDAAMNAFESLRTATEVRLRIERAGRQLELVEPVVGVAAAPKK